MVPRWGFACELETNVVGVTHANSNGTRRQTIVERLHRHSHADLRRERGNPVDFNAIAVSSRLGRVGYRCPVAGRTRFRQRGGVVLWAASD
jgi:hypothetical protein